MKHQAADALSHIHSNGEDNTPPGDNLLLLDIKTILKLGDTQLGIIDGTSDDVIPLEINNTEV